MVGWWYFKNPQTRPKSSRLSTSCGVISGNTILEPWSNAVSWTVPVLLEGVCANEIVAQKRRKRVKRICFFILILDIEIIQQCLVLILCRLAGVVRCTPYYRQESNENCGKDTIFCRYRQKKELSPFPLIFPLHNLKRILRQFFDSSVAAWASSVLRAGAVRF